VVVATRDVFSEQEMGRLRGFPEITRAELIRYFTLTSAEEEFLRNFLGRRNVLGASVQFCVLPWLGFVPDEVSAAPDAVVDRLADRLGIQVAELRGYGGRAQTRTDHLREIVRYLGWAITTGYRWPAPSAPGPWPPRTGNGSRSRASRSPPGTCRGTSPEAKASAPTPRCPISTPPWTPKSFAADAPEGHIVLDGILGNTDPPILEHATDTHGATLANFALFDLVGRQLSPRIRDLGKITCVGQGRGRSSRAATRTPERCSRAGATTSW
jgi:hypothetical protein